MKEHGNLVGQTYNDQYQVAANQLFEKNKQKSNNKLVKIFLINIKPCANDKQAKNYTQKS